MIFVELLKTICIFFDWLIYSVVSYCYVLFSAMCEMNVTKLGENLNGIMDRIQVFIGIVMLFVIAFNLLQMLVEPDKIEKESGNLVKKVAITIVLLVSMNFIFDLFSDFQTELLENNTIEKVILGVEDDPSNTIQYTGYNKHLSTGRWFSYNMLFAFADFDDTVKEPIIKGEKTLFTAVGHINDSGVTYEYPVISGICGIFLIVMLFSFAVDIGVRAFLLMILQVLAPIPIMAYVVPKGDGILQKYFKTYMSVFLQLFIKIFITYITLYLMMFCMNSILKDVTGSTFDKDSTMFKDLEGMPNIMRVLLLVVVMFALFKFAQQIPKILQDIFGIKMDTGALFKDTKAVIGGALGFGAGAVTGLAGGIAGGAGVTGTLAALGKGALGGATSGSRAKGVKDFVSGQGKNKEAVNKWAAGVGSQGGLVRGTIAKGAVAADAVAGKFRGDKKHIAENQRAAEKNKSAIEKKNASIQNVQNAKSAINKIYDTGANSYLKSKGYQNRQDYINALTTQNKTKLDIAKSSAMQSIEMARTSGMTGAELAAVETSAAEQINNAQEIYNNEVKEVNRQVDADMTSYTQSHYNDETDKELYGAFKEAQATINNNDTDLKDVTITDFDSLSTAENAIEEKSILLAEEKRSLDAETVRINKEAKELKNTTTGEWVKTSKEKAEETATKLGHGPEQKK